MNPNSPFLRTTRAFVLSAIVAALAVTSGAQQPANSSANTFAAHLDNIDYRGWHAIRLSNGLISLIIVPQIGGRAIQLKLGDQELFFVNPAFAGKVLTEADENPSTGQWNYGGDKVWPAPEGWLSDDQWSSIPDYPLDGKPATATVITNNSVKSRFASPAPPSLALASSSNAPITSSQALPASASSKSCAISAAARFAGASGIWSSTTPPIRTTQPSPIPISIFTFP